MKVFITLVAVCALVTGANIKPQRRAPRLDGRIVGGEDANIEDLPYQLALESYGFQICGASIISENWALTAAHCVQGSSADEFTLRAGSSRVDSGGSVHQAAEVIWHPQYDDFNLENDVALIRVETPFPVGQSGVQAVRLADSEPSAGTSCIASGWGSLSSGGIYPDQLQSVVVQIIGRSQCQNSYPGYDVTESMVCAGVEEGGKDACQGDSGGPLVSNGVQVGIVSWGIGCGGRGSPGVYSNVANLRSWIRETSGV